jgi:hypothetical protein
MSKKKGQKLRNTPKEGKKSRKLAQEGRLSDV